MDTRHHYNLGKKNANPKYSHQVLLGSMFGWI
jgi:hypothetical protein